MHLGIDPGTRNLGLAVTDGEGKLIRSSVLDMKELGGITKTAQAVLHIAAQYNTKTMGIERFVPYAGKHSAATEEILMLIGALIFLFETAHHKVTLYRAIEWKPALCKHLFKTVGFNNPSTSFDKKYSHAAARCITQLDVKTDHEADAICLSRMWITQDADKNKRS